MMLTISVANCTIRHNRITKYERIVLLWILAGAPITMGITNSRQCPCLAGFVIPPSVG